MNRQKYTHGPLGAGLGAGFNIQFPSFFMMNLRKFVGMTRRVVKSRSVVDSRRGFAARPWFVDEDDEMTPASMASTSESTGSASSPPIAPTVTIKPPPATAPPHLASTYAYLASLPLIDPSTVHIGSPIPPEAHPDSNLPLPMLKKVMKARGRKERGYGRGVGEGRGQGVYQWEVIAQVKEGTEARGAVEVVAASVRNMLRREFPKAPRPPKSLHKDQKDGWELLDLGNAAVHICSRKAWERWMDPRREW